MVNKDTDIIILGATENNLKNIDIRIPLNKITCITGKSGSGKSSLVDKIISKESSRLQKITDGVASEYDLLVRPSFKEIHNLPNCISIKQECVVRTDNSNVATYSGLNDYFRKLFVDKGQIFCSCGEKVNNTVLSKQIEPLLFELLDDGIYDFYSLISKNKKIEIEKIEKFSLIYNIEYFKVEGKNKNIDLKSISRLDKLKNFTIRAYIGSVHKDNLSVLNLNKFPINTIEVYDSSSCIFNFSFQTFCSNCNLEYQTKSISLFTRKNLSSLSGCCHCCVGKGVLKILNLEKLINKDVPVSDFHFLNIPHNGKSYKYINLQNSYIKKFTLDNHIDEVNFELLPNDEKVQFLDFISEKLIKYIEHPKVQEFILEEECKECNGSGFNRKATSVLYKNISISQLLKLTISDALTFFNNDSIDLTIKSLMKLSLGHLRLDRKTTTLSGGELQRLKLVDILARDSSSYLLIIDEPSLGLHRDDLQSLMKVFINIINEKNTLLLIDHNPFIISNSDNIIEIGPGSGVKGGYIVKTNTNDFFSDFNLYRKKSNINNTDFISFKNISYNNIIEQDINLPLNRLICLVGVSGSGKSSLASYISKNKKEQFNEIIMLNQFGITKNKRSTISTYIGVSDELRVIYTLTNRAKYLSLTKSDFTSNSFLGACEVCNGDGRLDEIICYGCDGKKINPFILSIMLDGINIYELNNIPINELKGVASTVVSNKKILRSIEVLIELGLGHLTFGTKIPSISGGEAQRIKLAKYFLENSNSILNSNTHNLLILDEPSQGLNTEDSINILKIIDNILSVNNTVLIIEHNDIMVKNSDYIIKLGPKAGDLGGIVNFCGLASDFFRTNEFSDEFSDEFSHRKTHSSKIYPSAMINNTIDNSYFKKIDDFYLNFKVLSPDFNVLNFNSKGEVYNYYKNNYPNMDLFFNPFCFKFIMSSYVSYDDIKNVFILLNKFGITEVEVDGVSISTEKARSYVDNTNCWGVIVKADNFEQAFEFGNGWVIIKIPSNILNLTTSLLSIENKVIGVRSVTKKTFNLYYNKCQTCKGDGEVKFSDFFIKDYSKNVLDVEFYHELFTKVMQDKLLRKLTLIFSTFNSQKLFNFNKPFKDFSDLDIFIYHYGLSGHKFLKNGGRKSAKEDFIQWPGITNFLVSNSKYFSNELSQSFMKYIKIKKCPVCLGSKYNKELNYYLNEINDEKILK